jgi:hypothetical protein
MNWTPRTSGHSTAALCLAAVVALAAMTGCSDGTAAPAWTAQPDGTAAGTPNTEGTEQPGTAVPGNTTDGGPSSTSGAPGSSTASPTPGPGGSPAPGATALAWKSYSDPAKRVSFDLPREWIAQSVPPDQGSLPGALKIEVKDSEGRYLATLHTGLQPASPAPCADDAARPYVVINSVPLDVPHSDGEGTISPRAVFRVIQGYKFFGSYGITNMVGGSDGKACQLRNLVQGPAGKGNYYFGDLPGVRAFAVDEKVAPAKSFDTLDEASKYVNESAEFANVQRMLLSLKINL